MKTQQCAGLWRGYRHPKPVGFGLLALPQQARSIIINTVELLQQDLENAA